MQSGGGQEGKGGREEWIGCIQVEVLIIQSQLAKEFFSHGAKHKEEVVTLYTRRSIAEIAGTKTAD